MAAPQIYRAALESIVLPTGVIGIKGSVKLLIRNRWHQYEELPVRVDSGTTVTTIPLSVAQEMDLPVSQMALDSEILTPAGKIHRPIYAGQLSVRVPGWKHQDFIWPCHFVDYPDEEPPSLLGLSGVINDVFLFFDSTYALEAPFGWVVLQELLKEQATPAPAAIQA